MINQNGNDDTILIMNLENKSHEKLNFVKWESFSYMNNWKEAFEDCSTAIFFNNPYVFIMGEGIEAKYQLVKPVIAYSINSGSVPVPPTAPSTDPPMDLACPTEPGGRCIYSNVQSCYSIYNCSGIYYWKFTDITDYVNSWNVTVIEMNGIDYSVS
ncbi:MAG: hypothetical protein JXB88_17410 [Spirochaetales bacterium]|nr:hypothetical protein [Spirochaetales bacterium]